MSSLIQEATIKIRQDTSGNWSSENATPLSGEWCLETDTGLVKIGDGSTAWDTLDYYADTELANSNKEIVNKNEGEWIKNQCTAWVIFDGTETPPEIKASYNIDDVVRNSTGVYIIYFDENMNRSFYSINITASWSTTASSYNMAGAIDENNLPSKSSFKISTRRSGGTLDDQNYVSVQIFGGKQS